MLRIRATAAAREVRTLGVLLGCAVLLAALLAWRAYAALLVQRESTERELHGETDFAAYSFASHAGRDVYWGLIDLFAPAVPHNEVRRGGPGIALSAIPADPCEYDFTCQILDSVTAWFRLDLRTRQINYVPIRGDGHDAQRVVDSIVARLRTSPPPRAAPFIQIFDQRFDGLVAMIATIVPDTGPLVAAYGFEVPARLYGAAMISRSTGRGRPLLPASLRPRVPGESPPYTLRLTDADGRVLAGDTANWNPPDAPARAFTARVPIDSTGRDLFAEVALRPAYVADRAAASSPQTGLAAVGLFLVLDLIVIAALALRLRRVVGENRWRATFTASVSHELRTPLTQILLYGESLREGSLRVERDRRHASDVIVREARRLLTLIDNLLRFSRAERGMVEGGAEGSSVDVAPEITAAVQELRVRGAAGKARIVTDLDPAAQAASESPALRQIVTNLVDNALRYGPEEQTLTVGCRSDGRWVRMWVDDQGPGIPVSERDHVWEPFVRLEQQGGGVAVATGTGLGLAVVRQLAQAVGGCTWIEDLPGGGARFIVLLRRVHARNAQRESA